MNHLFRGAVAALLSSITLPAAAQDLSLSFLGQRIVPFGAQNSGTTIGGLSGLDYDRAADRYIAISDDQVNARTYTLDLDFTGDAFAGVTFTGSQFLKAPGGATYATGTIDPESIRYTASNRFVYSSEGFNTATATVAPFVREASTDGTYVRDFAIPGYYAPVLGGPGVRNNLAFESLTLSNDGASLLTATENALFQDGPAATATTGSPSRILQFNLASGAATAEYVYQNDPLAVAPNPSTNFGVNGLVELLGIGGSRYLAVERSFTVGAPGTGYSIKLFTIDLNGATNVLGTPALSGASYTAVSKTLLLDLATLGLPLDNIEGVTFGKRLSNGDRTLILVADDNFNPTQIQQFLAFRVTGSVVPEPASWAMMIGGFGIMGGAMRRRRSAGATVAA